MPRVIRSPLRRAASPAGPTGAGLVACSLAAALAACSGDGVEEQWEERATLPSCGTVTLEGGAALARDRGAELACLEAAFGAGRAAELEVRSFTQEGDPVVEYYRVTTEGTTEVYVDSTRDPSSDGSWSFGSCARPRNALDVC